MTMTYKPRNDIVIVQKVEEKFEEKKVGGIILPDQDKGSMFIKLKVLAVGPKVEGLSEGDIVLADNMMEPINKSETNVGLILEKYIRCII